MNLNFKWEILKKIGESGYVELRGWIMLKILTKSARGTEYDASIIRRQGEGFVYQYFTVTQICQEEITE